MVTVTVISALAALAVHPGGPSHESRVGRLPRPAFVGYYIYNCLTYQTELNSMLLRVIVQ